MKTRFLIRSIGGFRRGLSFITASATPSRNAREFSQAINFGSLLKLARAVRENRYDLAVVFHAPWWVSFVLWLARVPVRIGVRSQWHSFLFFNRGVRQKRSRAEASELEYNFRLLEEGLALASGSLARGTLRLHAKSGRPELAPTAAYYVVHPGMSGSALNWSSENYAELIRRLLKEATVVITGTASDEPFLAPLRGALADSAGIVWLDGKLNGEQLIGLLENARAVIAPSTGVMHLAASAGVPTLGLFSRIRVQRALRWGPQGPRTAVVEAPSEDIGAMDLITVDEVLKSLRALVH